MLQMLEQHKKLIDEMIDSGDVILQNGVYLATTVKFSSKVRKKLTDPLQRAILYFNRHIFKQCTNCGKLTSRQHFDWHVYMPDGLSPICRACKNEMLRLKAYHFRIKKAKRSRRSLSIKNKAIVFLRDAHQCLLCASNRDLQVHHIIPVKDLPGLDLELRNLATLCKKCHCSIAHPTTQSYDKTVAKKLALITGLTELAQINLPCSKVPQSNSPKQKMGFYNIKQFQVD